MDIIIIGSGITGLTAAKYAAQTGLATGNIEALMFGGLVININEIDGVPDGEHVSGISLATKLMAENADLSVTHITEAVTALTHQDDGSLSVVTDGGCHLARAVIIASGAQLKRLDIPGELEFQHRGVSQCADCDAPMYKDKDVLVVGGGDSALQEALVLANYCARVHLVIRGNRFRAREHLIAAVLARKNIHVMLNMVAEEVVGTRMVEGVRLRNVVSGETSLISCAGLFPYIGLEPNCGFAPEQVKRDSNGSLMTDKALHTAMAGVFAAGAVRAGYGGLLSDAVADAKKATSAAHEWISNN